MGKGKPSISIVLGKPPKAPESDPEMEDDEEEEDGEMEVSEDHVLAMKAFEKAKSPEEKAKALMAFIKCCD